MPRGTSRYDEAQIQGRLWTPAVLRSQANLCGWYDFTNLGTIGLNSGTGRLSDVADISGFARNLTQSNTANRPSYDGSRRYVDTISTSDWYVGGGVAPSHTSGRCSIAIALIPSTGSQAAYCGVVFSRGNATGLTCSSAGTNYGYTWNGTSDTYDWVSGATITAYVPAIVVLTFDSSNKGVLYVNGTAYSNSGSASHSTDTGATGFDFLHDGFSGSRAWKGYTLEGFVTSTPLSANEVHKATGYLAHKHGFTSYIKGPFASRPPLIGD